MSSCTNRSPPTYRSPSVVVNPRGPGAPRVDIPPTFRFLVTVRSSTSSSCAVRTPLTLSPVMIPRFALKLLSVANPKGPEENIKSASSRLFTVRIPILDCAASN